MANNTGTVALIAGAAVAAFALSRVGSTQKTEVRQAAKVENVETRQEAKVAKIESKQEGKTLRTEARQEGRTSRTETRTEAVKDVAEIIFNKPEIKKTIPQESVPFGQQVFKTIPDVKSFSTTGTSVMPTSKKERKQEQKEERQEARQQAISNIKGKASNVLQKATFGLFKR
jgi:hypothetical protein